MKAIGVILCLMVGLVAASPPGRAAETLTLTADDQVEVFADYYSAGSKAKPLVLLFHQAGSNRAEYATIGPMLVALGFNALAIDQRSGGPQWGRVNETVQRLGKSAGFGEALRDLEAAVQWAKTSGHTGPIIVWGSSYSAALVFVLAVRHPAEIKAILAFSPGEYLGGSASVRNAASLLSMPIFVTSASDPGEIAAARAIIDAARSSDKVQFVPRIAGVHGSSTLRADRNPKGAEENWAAVKEFLAHLPT
jgi:dienelactone hydrolase